MPRQSVAAPNPGRFNLKSFADILPRRDPTVGEELGYYAIFHPGMTQSLAPPTPYEYVKAENLISIEWNLMHHWRMGDACLGEAISKHMSKAPKA